MKHPTIPGDSLHAQLRDMRLIDALRLSVRLSGRTEDQIAHIMGYSSANASRIFAPEEYWPTLPNIPRLCAALGNTVLLDWLRVQAEEAGLKYDIEPETAVGLIFRLGRLFRELGDVAREGEKAVDDSDIDQQEARRLLKHLHVLAAEVLNAISGLRVIERSEMQGAY